MATIWQKKQNGTTYEVRKAGNSIRLYTDGVFHSQYNPHRPVTGSVWDLLMLPAFFSDVDTIKRVLVLGVGGGAAIQLLHRHVKPDLIIGVEINPVHIQVAKQFFGINNKIAKLVKADAIDWMENYKGPPFDMIVDDLFGEINGEGVRPVPLNARWLGLLNKHLTKHGILVANMVDRKSLRESAYYSNKRVNGFFRSAFQLTIPQLENIVAAFNKNESSGKTFRKHINQTPGLNSRHGPDRLKIRVSEITQ